MIIDIRQDDVHSEEMIGLISEHLAGMHSNSPPGHVNALALDKLRHPTITFWGAWIDGQLCGCGALKELDAISGEVKSMRTRPRFLRLGVGQAVLTRILSVSQARGYERVYLETGTGPAFEAAHSLYRRNGFEFTGPFGDYTATEFNVFMVKRFK